MQEDKIKFFTNHYLYELSLDSSEVSIANEVNGDSDEAYENYLIQSKNNRFEVYEELLKLECEKISKDELRNLILKNFKKIDILSKKEIHLFKNALVRDLEMEVYKVDSFLNEEVLNYNFNSKDKVDNIDNAINKIFKKVYNYETIDENKNKGLFHFQIKSLYEKMFKELIEVYGDDHCAKIDSILISAQSKTNKQIKAATEYIRNYSSETIKTGNERFINNIKIELDIIDFEEANLTDDSNNNLHYELLYEKKKLGDLPNFEMAKKRSHYIEKEKLEKFKREILKDDEHSKELPLEKVFMK